MKMIDILQGQLTAANATIAQLNLTIQSMEANFAATVDDLQRTITDLRKTVANLEGLLQERDASLEKSKAVTRGLKGALLPKMSERQKLRPKTDTEIEVVERQRTEQRKARKNNGARRNMHFEMETVTHEVDPEGVVGGEVIKVREAIRYEMVPMRFIKHVYLLKSVKKDGLIYNAKAPLAPLLNSSFDGSFIAGLAQLRYLYSMPVERMVAMFRENGFDMDKATAHGLLAKTAGLFEKLYGAMRQAVKESGYLCCDETYHTILLDPLKNGGRGSKKGYIWVIVSAQSGLCYFFYDDGSRSQRVILEELKDYEGIVQSDALQAYKNLAKLSDGKILRVGCLQHCKRDFLSDELKDNPDAKRIIGLSNSLYAEEHKHKIGKDGWTVHDNLKWRREYAPPILAALKTELLRVQGMTSKYPPKSLMAKAVNYFLNEWDGIEAISNYGDVSWDNNLVERTNRYISLSRHNSLFFGSHTGAERGCIFYSLACSCRLHRINFFEYLSDVLNRATAMHNCAPLNAYRDLLPDRWKTSRDE